MDGSGSRKITRRKGACVNCRQKKVRCDGSPTCSQCLKSNLTCTYSKYSSERRTSNTSINTPRSSTASKPQEFDEFASFLNSPIDLQTELYSLDPTSQFQFQEPSAQSTYDENSPFALSTLPALNTSPVVEPSQTAKQGNNFSSGSTWNKVWAEDLCSDFSSLAPLRSLGKYIEDSRHHLSKSLWAKARRVSRQCASSTGARSGAVVPSYDLNIITPLIDAFCHGCYGYPTFVSRDYLNEIVTDMLIAPNTVDSCASALLHAVLAMGCRILSRRDKSDSSPTSWDAIPRPCQYFRLALKQQNDLMSGAPSIPKIQALVAMILYMRHHHDTSLTRSFLSLSIHMIHDLKLSIAQDTATAEAREQHVDIERLFWLLYSIEKPFTLRFGGHSIIDDDHIVFDPPFRARGPFTSSTMDYTGWDIVHYRYARLCSVIKKALYSHSSVGISPTKTMTSIDRLSSMLEAWRQSIPLTYRPTCGAGPSLPVRQPHEESWGVCIQTDILLKYAEASIAIHRWAVMIQTPPSGVTTHYSASRNQCIEMAKELLRLTHCFPVDESETDWIHIMLPLLGAVLIYIVLAKQEGTKDLLPHLGMACGHFGRLHAIGCTGSDLFEEVSELYLLAHRQLNNPQQPSLISRESKTDEDPRVADANILGMDPVPDVDFDMQYFEFPQDVSDNIFGFSHFNEAFGEI